MTSGSQDLLDLDWDIPVNTTTPGKGNQENVSSAFKVDSELLLDFGVESSSDHQGTSSAGNSNMDLLLGISDPAPSKDTTNKTSCSSISEEDAFLFDPLATPHYSAVEVRKEPQGSVPYQTGGDNPETLLPRRSEPPVKDSRPTRVGSVDLDDLLSSDSNNKHLKMSETGGKREKRSMEKSFEDLLAGLEDEELDLDEIIDPKLLPQKITDASFNAMAQQPTVTYRISREEAEHIQETVQEEDRNEEFEIITYDEVKHNVKEKEPIQHDDDDDNELQQEEEEPQQEEEEPQEEEEEPKQEVDIMVVDENDDLVNEKDSDSRRPVSSDMEDDGAEPQNSECEIKREASLDFSAVEGTSHLDVHIGKQKTSLRKKGSLARRKKPSRTNVRSMLSSSEDSHFQDSTEPKPSPTEVNGYSEDVFDTDKSDSAPTSPPAKKPSHIMMPLPGLGKPLPAARKTPSRSEEKEDIPTSAQKKDYKAMGVKLPMPQLKPMKRESKNEDSETGPVFEKPSLRTVSSSEPEKEKDIDFDGKFEVPALRNVPKDRTKKEPDSDDMDTDKYFTKPALKSVPKPDKDEEEMPSSPEEKLFDRPALRRVQRDVQNTPAKDTFESDKFDIPVLKTVSKDISENRTKVSPSESDGTFGIPVLRNVPQGHLEMKRSESQELESDKTFAKPPLRNTPKPKTEPLPSPQDKGKFDLPALRRTPRVDRSGSVEQKLGSAFDVPALRNVSKPVNTKLEFSDDVSETSENKHTFEKPALRNIPRSNSRTDTTADPDSERKPDEPNWFKEMKLRKTKSVSDENVDMPEKEKQAPWVKVAAEKRGRAAEIISSKEVHNKADTPSKPDWTERLRKTPNGLPLQESSENQDNRLNRVSSIDEDIKGFGRRVSVDREPSSPARSNGTGRDQYEPSWLKTKGTRHKSTPNLQMTPADSSEVPQWKRELAERRKLKKDSDIPQKAVKPADNLEPGLAPWKRELSLKKIGTPTMRGVTSSSKVVPVEPEWKKQADERRQRIMNSGLLESQRRKMKMDNS